MNSRSIVQIIAVVCVILVAVQNTFAQQNGPSEKETLAAIDEAISFYSNKVSRHGGYVYFYSADLKRRLGEGVATADQAWVQPPGTPTVGMAYLKAYDATDDLAFLDAARKTGVAMEFGQVRSGGWTNEFDLAGIEKGFRYSGGNKRADRTTSLDDGQTQSAIRFMSLLDKALDFKDERIHQCTISALDALLKAQFPNGAFPQGWKTPVEKHPVLNANFPEYDWRTEGRIKNYWDMYTLNDNVAGYVAETLIETYHVYGNEQYLAALKKLGDFLILAQMPDPQPAWAQQYNYEMQPIWARKFEPPGISGDESQEAIETLMKISIETGDKKFLEPIPRAIAYLRASELHDGQLARYYELKTNRPLYMQRNGEKYTLTYNDSNLPTHYAFKTRSKADALEKQYTAVLKNGKLNSKSDKSLAMDARRIVDSLDEQGRWISIADSERLVGQAMFEVNSEYISSEVFSKNIETLSRYLVSLRK